MEKSKACRNIGFIRNEAVLLRKEIRKSDLDSKKYHNSECFGDYMYVLSQRAPVSW